MKRKINKLIKEIKKSKHDRVNVDYQIALAYLELAKERIK